MQQQLCSCHSLVQERIQRRWTNCETERPQRRPPSSLAGVLRLLLLILCLPTRTHAFVFKVGVVGPWSCDPLFGKAMPGAAAQLAVDRINMDASLSLGSTFEYVLLEEDCHTSVALQGFLDYYRRASAFVGPTNPGYCDAAALLARSWNKALFSWACVGHEQDEARGHSTFARTLPPPTRALLVFLRHFRWAHLGVVSSAEEGWVETGRQVASALRSHGLPVGLVTSVGPDPASLRHALARIKRAEHLRLVILCMHSVLIGGETQKRFLETAYDMQLTDGSLVFVPYDTLLYSLPYHDTHYPALQNSSKLRRAYDAVLTITLESHGPSFYQAYQQAIEHGELPITSNPISSVLLVAHALKAVQDSGAWLTGENLARHSRSLAFPSFTQRIRTNGSGARLLDYTVLDTDGQSCALHPTHRIDVEAGMVRYLNRPIHFPHGHPPKTDSSCWFTHGKICTGGVDSFFVLSIFLSVFLLVLVLMGISYFIRRRISQIRMVRGPNKILLTLADVTFINPSLSNKKLSTDDSKDSDTGRRPSDPDHSLKSPYSASSLSPATHENSNVAIYEVRGRGRVGLWSMQIPLADLQDLLQNEDVKLDWMFKSSLLLDLIKGMKYLHHRYLCHGRLKSRNCVVDGRFVLKVTDYSYNEVLEAQRFPYVQPPPEQLLWMAPELLRVSYPGLSGSLPGDVYSFSIIMQEVVIRGPPFCMLGLSAEELIQKLQKPPPLCRPVVSPDYAPPECIQLMKQCWSEQPEKRPPFEEIFDQFKNVNKGKKTNIIDSMLRMLEQYSSNLEELIRERTEELEIEKQKTEKLLTQMLPPSVAEALKVGCTVEPEYFEGVTLYFSDVVGFTTISANSEPIEVVDLLNDLYTLFDAIIGNHDVYKVETIGDAYMVASGLPVPNGDRHAAEISNMALDILSAVGTFKMRHMPDVPVRIRIGLHTGPCVAGVVGLTMPRYCLFGDTVNTASRMESTGMPYRIHVSDSTVKILLDLKEGYKVQLRGRTELKGRGMEETYWLIGKEGFTKPLPLPPELKPGQKAHGLQVEEIAQYKRRKAELASRRN
ncbi:hypothetical protein AAFF_G00312640 [Aldrovandia affinis]|uniref:Guanylate cyclase n=1 Tax=Aldrovandia affinis TaxID=143900 RepID=A0AAD7SNA4_9TELE|nr:hypothetical protein AAFF_G00312640 [Aldrovandia affinis]